MPHHTLSEDASRPEILFYFNIQHKLSHLQHINLCKLVKSAKVKDKKGKINAHDDQEHFKRCPNILHSCVVKITVLNVAYDLSIRPKISQHKADGVEDWDGNLYSLSQNQVLHSTAHCLIVSFLLEVNNLKSEEEGEGHVNRQKNVDGKTGTQATRHHREK